MGPEPPPGGGLPDGANVRVEPWVLAPLQGWLQQGCSEPVTMPMEVNCLPPVFTTFLNPLCSFPCIVSGLTCDLLPPDPRGSWGGCGCWRQGKRGLKSVSDLPRVTQQVGPVGLLAPPRLPTIPRRPSSLGCVSKELGFTATGHDYCSIFPLGNPRPGAPSSQSPQLVSGQLLQEIPFQEWHKTCFERKCSFHFLPFLSIIMHFHFN